MFIHWIIFILFVLLLLALDLGIFHRKIHVIRVREALFWTFLWIIIALLFDVFIYFAYKNQWIGLKLAESVTRSGGDAALKYFTGYLIEKSLSIDNIFVMAMIFAYFKIPALYQHKVLFWGILGALTMRGIMISSGLILIRKYEWMTTVFGLFLILAAIRMLIIRDNGVNPGKNIWIKIVKRIYPITDRLEGSKFFARREKITFITPLFLVLIVIESTDVVFAIDSIPAIFSITNDPFIIFTSNIFAILGLRSLYFAFAAVMDRFRYLKISVMFVLLFVGIKMIISNVLAVTTLFSLILIVSILFIGMFFSVRASKK
jgi:tellurite resistance protein TerC